MRWKAMAAFVAAVLAIDIRHRAKKSPPLLIDRGENIVLDQVEW